MSRLFFYFETRHIFNCGDMKIKAGKIVGFAFGLVGFLLLFKGLFLVNIRPEDELAPGVVVFAAVLSGLLFAFAGQLVQDFLRKRKL